MKKFLITLVIAGFLSPAVKAQCPPNASAFESIYPLCPAGCGVLLKDWPEGVIVNIFGGAPLTIITSAIIPGTYGGPGVGDAFVCVPCNVQLIFASAVPGATNGCVINNGGIVPIKLNSFSANSTGTGSSSLKWSTAYESGNVKFIVQRSNDGRNFADITTLTGNGSSNGTRNYTYTDASATQGTSYYRLKVVEITGNTTFSETALVKNLQKFGISIYPNPVVDNFKITVPGQFLPATVNVYNAQGAIVYTEKMTQSTLSVNKQLPSGVYAVKIQGNNNESISQTLIKR